MIFPETPYFVSLNPYVRLDKNLSIFDSLDDPEIRATLQRASGVVLPTYLSPWRYQAITRLARRWFPRL